MNEDNKKTFNQLQLEKELQQLRDKQENIRREIIKKEREIDSIESTMTAKAGTQEYYDKQSQLDRLQRKLDDLYVERLENECEINVVVQDIKIEVVKSDSKRNAVSKNYKVQKHQKVKDYYVRANGLISSMKYNSLCTNNDFKVRREKSSTYDRLEKLSDILGESNNPITSNIRELLDKVLFETRMCISKSEGHLTEQMNSDRERLQKISKSKKIFSQDELQDFLNAINSKTRKSVSRKQVKEDNIAQSKIHDIRKPIDLQIDYLKRKSSPLAETMEKYRVEYESAQIIDFIILELELMDSELLSQVNIDGIEYDFTSARNAVKSVEKQLKEVRKQCEEKLKEVNYDKALEEVAEEKEKDGNLGKLIDLYTKLQNSHGAEYRSVSKEIERLMDELGPESYSLAVKAQEVADQRLRDKVYDHIEQDIRKKRAEDRMLALADRYGLTQDEIDDIRRMVEIEAYARYPVNHEILGGDAYDFNEQAREKYIRDEVMKKLHSRSAAKYDLDQMGKGLSTMPLYTDETMDEEVGKSR